MNRVIVLVLLLLFSVNAYAGSLTANVTVEKVVISKANAVGTNRACVYLSSAITENPSCNIAGRLCCDVDEAIGKALLSSALTAYSTGNIVTVAGSGECTVDSKSEDIFYIWLRK